MHSAEAATGEVPKDLAKFIGKHLCQSLLFNNVADFKPKKNSNTGVLLKKKTPTQVFSFEISEIFTNTVFTEQLRAAASDSINDLRQFSQKDKN